jgi:hypothetical protein
VLAIFMGGMALGAWAASRWSRRWPDLLLAYALVEAVIGIGALVFHAAFVDTTALVFERVIPQVGSAGLVDLIKWSVGALLILPQSVLLGATFPLLTGAVLPPASSISAWRSPRCCCHAARAPQPPRRKPPPAARACCSPSRR